MYDTLHWAIYARKSSEGDERQAASVPDQNKVVGELAEAESFNVVTSLGEARSAKEPHTRPAFAELIRQIRLGKVNGILCWHIDRLSRNPVDSAEIQMLLQKGMIKCIRTMHRTYVPEDNAVIFAVESSMANQYSRDISRNVSRGLTEKARRGWWPHKAPPGYINVTVGDEKLIAVDPPQFEMLRRAVDLATTGEYSLAEILAKLREWGFTIHSKRLGRRPISRSRFYEIFANRFYVGEILYKGEVIKGNHQPLLSYDEYHRLQRLLGRPTRIRSVKDAFAFAGGLITCGTCGCAITAERKMKHYRQTQRMRTYVYYRCTGARGCLKTAITEEDLSTQFGKLIAACSISDQIADIVAPILLRALSQSEGDIITILQNQETSLAETQRRLNVIFEMRLRGELTSEEYIAQKSKLTHSQIGIEASMRDHDAKVKNIRSAVMQTIDQLKLLQERFLNASPELKRSLVRGIAEEYFLTLGTLTYRLHPLVELFVTFGLPQKPPQQVEKELSDNKSPVWSAMRDVIHTLVTEERV